MLIGRNNAGKSTIIEALRIAALAILRSQTARYEPTPGWLVNHSVGPGFYFSLEPIEFDKTFVHYNSFEDEPAQIEINFSSRHKIRVLLSKNERDAFCQIYRLGRYQIQSRAEVARLNLPHISVMPPIGTLLLREKRIREEHVQRHINGRLSHRHIRNQMAARPNEFDHFQQRLEETWSGLHVLRPEFGFGEEHNEFQLFIREPAYTSELGRVGSGLQAWIQMLWFLCRTEKDQSIVLDEPDVFLHADVQRKLLKLIASQKYRQTIIATHSVDIISDVSPESIIVVQKIKEFSKSATEVPVVQAALRNIGTVHNIQLSKISSHGKFLFVEGEDVKFLSEIAYKVSLATYEKFTNVAHNDIGGASNIQRAIGAAESLYKASGRAIQSFLLLDRDYKPLQVLEEIIGKGNQDSLFITIWKKKEIENFFLIEEVVHRIASCEVDGIPLEEIYDIFRIIEDELYQVAIRKRAQAFQEWKRKCGLEKALDEAQKEMNEAISSGAAKRDFCSGKTFVSRLNSTLIERYGAQINAMALCRECRLTELHPQIVRAVESLL